MHSAYLPIYCKCVYMRERERERLVLGEFELKREKRDKAEVRINVV